MSDYIDNPAGRLLAIFRRAKGLDERLLPAQARVAWALVFDITGPNPNPQHTLTPEEEIEVIERVVQLRLLINETEDSLQNMGGVNTEPYLRPFPRFRSAVSPTELTTQFASFIHRISDGDLDVLELCAERLSHFHKEPTVEEDQLRELLEDINALYEEVAASSINNVLRKLILDQLENLRRAINEYRIRGIERLREAVAVTLGTIILNKDTLEEAAATKEVSRFGQIFWKAVSLVKYAPSAVKVIEAVAKYAPLLLGSGPTDRDVPPPPME